MEAHNSVELRVSEIEARSPAARRAGKKPDSSASGSPTKFNLSVNRTKSSATGNRGLDSNEKEQSQKKSIGNLGRIDEDGVE